MLNGGPDVSKGSRSPRLVPASSDIARVGKRTSSASMVFWRSYNAGRPRRHARGGGREQQRGHVVDSAEEADMPTTMEKAQVTLPSDREVKVTRSFRAARPLVYKAYTEPALVQRWLLGPPGWSMP